MVFEYRFPSSGRLGVSEVRVPSLPAVPQHDASGESGADAVPVDSLHSGRELADSFPRELLGFNKGGPGFGEPLGCACCVCVCACNHASSAAWHAFDFGHLGVPFRTPSSTAWARGRPGVDWLPCTVNLLRVILNVTEGKLWPGSAACETGGL